MAETKRPIPGRIDREDYKAMFQSIGLDPSDIAEATCRPGSLDLVLFERDEDGKRIFLRDGAGEIHECAKYTASIPVL